MWRAPCASAKLSTESVFDFSINPDDKNPNAYAVDLTQSGLGMPDREFYLSSDPSLVTIRQAYLKYLTDMLTLAGFDKADKRAAAILAAETAIAKVQWDRADRRDADKTYNPMSIPELKKFAPDFPWDAMFKEAGIPETTAAGGPRMVVVGEKSAFPKIAEVFAKTPVSVWRDYLAVHYLHAKSSYLPEEVRR